MYMAHFYTLNKRLKECHNDMDFLKKNGITVDRVKAERRRRDAAAKAERRRRDAAAKAGRRRMDVAARANAAVGPLGADAVFRDILLDQQKQNNPTPSEQGEVLPVTASESKASSGGRKTRRKRRRKKKKSRRKKKTRRRRKKRKTRKKRR
jgi:hypothetical protein